MQLLKYRLIRAIYCLVLFVAMSIPSVAVGSSDQQSMEGGASAARQKQQALIEQARKVLAQKDMPLPSAPSVELECIDNIETLINSPSIQSFAQKAAEPEGDLLQQLLDVRRQLQVLGADASASYSLELELLQRLKKKSELLLQQYGRHMDRHNKLPALVAFTIRTAKLFGLLGDASAASSLMNQLSAWIANLLPLMVRDLREKHDYRQMKAIFIVTQAANLVGAETGNADVDKVYQQIEAAMQFDLSLTFKQKLTSANGVLDDWNLQCEIPVHFAIDVAEKDSVAKPLLSGSGTGKYVSYYETDPSPLTMTAPPFEVNVRIDNFDPCTGKATIYIDRFFADSETYTGKWGPVDEPKIKWGWQILFMDQFKQGLFTFDVPVTNLSATPIDEQISKTVNRFSGTLTIKLVHKPR